MMNDNTILRIHVPAHLYESIKQKLTINEAKGNMSGGAYTEVVKEKKAPSAPKAKVQTVPAPKAKAQPQDPSIPEEDEGKMDMNEANLDESALTDILSAIAGAAGIGLSGMAVAKAQEMLQKKNPELYKKLQAAQQTMSKSGVGMIEEAEEEEKDEE